MKIPEELDSWLEVLPFFKDKAFLELLKRIKKIREDTRVYPEERLVFNAFKRTPFDKLKVLILGQDPYHGEGQAHGLAFSVPEGVKPPPSLVNILKEVSDDMKIDLRNRKSDLSDWADQGVLLINSILTVEESRPMSHKDMGWEVLNRELIRKVSEKKDHLVFIFWGAKSRSLAEFVDRRKHLILTAAHPSPLSAYRGFFGCRHFSKTNAWLRSKGLREIEW